MNNNEQPMFPAFENFAERTGLLQATGILAARLPRILGKGKTRAEGLDLPPATIERQQELIALTLPQGVTASTDVKREIEDAKRAVDAHAAQMRSPDNRRRFALQVLHSLEDVPTGNKDNQFYAGRFVLVHDKAGQNWAWSLTPHYPVIDKIPADVDYVVRAHKVANQIVDEWTLPVSEFLTRLQLAWTIARHFSSTNDVLIADVARVYKIAAQDERFWGTPARRNFKDVPEAVFIANLVSWRRNRDATSDAFELVPATLNQAHGPNARPFFVPSNAEGTVVRPMIYMRRQSN